VRKQTNTDFYKLRRRIVNLLLVLFLCVISVLIWELWHRKMQVVNNISTPEKVVYQTVSSDSKRLAGVTLQNNSVTFGMIAPSVWAQEFRTQSVVTQANINDYLQGDFVRPTDTVAPGAIAGTYNSGFSITNDSVTLGADTVGDFIKSIQAGDGLTVTGSGEAANVSLNLVAGDGISIAPSGISTLLHDGGGLSIASGGLTLLSDCTSNQILKWNATMGGWSCAADNSGAGTLTVRESDGANSLVPISLLEFGPASSSNDAFVVSDQGGGTARVDLGNTVPRTNATATISSPWTFNSAITANGGLSCADCIALGSETTGAYLAGLLAGSGIAVTNTGGESATPTVGLDLTNPNTWSGVQTFSNGFALGGNTYTDLAGTGLAFSGGALSTTLGTSIDSGEIVDGTITSADIGDGAITANQLGTGAVTSSKILDGTIATADIASGAITGPLLANNSVSNAAVVDGTLTLAKLGQNGCASGQIVKWNGSTWACAADVSGDVNTDSQTLSLNSNSLSISGGNSVSLAAYLDNTDVLAGLSCGPSQVAKWNGSVWACAADADTTYSAGTGLSLASGVFSLNLSNPNTWTSVQTFSNGFSLNGNTYTNLAGTGLAFSGGTLSTTLGTSIDSGEIVDGTITATDVADGTLTLAKLGQNGCTSNQIVKWNGSAWACAVDASASYSAGSGLSLASTTFSVNLATGGGLAFSSGALGLLPCSEGQVLKVTSGAWACAADTNAPTEAFKMQLSGADNVTIGSSLTPLLTNGSGTPQSLPVTIVSGTSVDFIATVQFSTSLASGPITLEVVRNDNGGNSCSTGAGVGTVVGAPVTSFLTTVGQNFLTTISFADTSPGTASPRYQLCASTTISLGTVLSTSRSLKLLQVTYQ